MTGKPTLAKIAKRVKDATNAIIDNYKESDVKDSVYKLFNQHVEDLALATIGLRRSSWNRGGFEPTNNDRSVFWTFVKKHAEIYAEEWMTANASTFLKSIKLSRESIKEMKDEAIATYYSAVADKIDDAIQQKVGEYNVDSIVESILGEQLSPPEDA